MNVSTLPFHNIINMLLIGILFMTGIMFLFPEQFDVLFAIISVHSEASFIIGVMTVAVIYEIGIILDRLSSLITEKLFKNKKPYSKRNLISRILQMQWKDYENYQRAEKINANNIKTLTREYTYSRNSLTTFLILSLIAVSIGKMYVFYVTFSLSVLFYFSMRKHADKIADRVDFATKNPGKEIPNEG